MVRTLGCTGGIGSGKSYVSRIFAKLGYPVYYSDDRAKLLYDTNSALVEKMAGLLGNDILLNGKIDRAKLAGKIFGNGEMLAKVEALVHPAVIEDFTAWKTGICESMQEKGIDLPGFVVFESAILLEKPLVRSCVSKTVNVVAPYELRIERVMKRDGATREQVIRRMDNQWSDAQRNALSDFTIFADSRRAVLPQILEVIEKMKWE